MPVADQGTALFIFCVFVFLLMVFSWLLSKEDDL